MAVACLVTSSALAQGLQPPPPPTNIAPPGPLQQNGGPPPAQPGAAQQNAGTGNVQLILDTGGFANDVRAVSFSPDGRFLAAGGEKVVRIWSLETGELRATLRGEQDRAEKGNVYAVAFSPDGSELVVGIDHHGQEGSIRVYRTDNLNEIAEIVGGHNVPVRQLAFTRDGRFLASTGDNGDVILWSWRERRAVTTIKPRNASGAVYSYANFPRNDSILMLLGDGTPRFIDAASGREIQGNQVHAELQAWLQSFGRTEFPGGGSPNQMAMQLERGGLWSCGGTVAARNGYWTATWQGNRPAPTMAYRGNKWEPTAVAISPDGRLIANGDRFGEVHVIDAATGSPVYVFRGEGRPIYQTAYDQNSQLLSFGVTPHGAGEWRANFRGKLDHGFRLSSRAIDQLPVPLGANPLTSQADVSVTSVARDRQFSLSVRRGNQELYQYKMDAFIEPACWTMLTGQKLGLQLPLVYGGSTGGLECVNPQTGLGRRDFVGHSAFISALSLSSDGRFLASGSTDRTMRIWSLTNYAPSGYVDFRHTSDAVIEVRPGTVAERLGIRVGDRIVRLDGHSLDDLMTMRLAGAYPYKPGDVVRLTMSRNNQPYEVQFPLVEGADLVEPLVSIFVTAGGEWVMWTPQGYFDASLGGARYVGFHVNRGHDKSAQFLPVDVFKDQLYRPDIIDQALQTASLSEAIVLANDELAGTQPNLDFRQIETIESHAPPEVTIAEPRDGARTKEGTITLRGLVKATNSKGIREVKVLIDGRPAGEPIALSGGDTQNIEQTIPLKPGRNQIALLATNDSATSEPVEVTVTYTPQTQSEFTRPNLYVLAIGISDYKDPSLKLKFAKNDAVEFERLVQRQSNGILYNQVETKLLTNEEASREAILDGFDWLLRSTTAGDIAMVFISGHGFRDNRQEYFLGHYGVDPERLTSTGISFRQIQSLVEVFPCKIVMFVDTCHSAGILGAKGVFDPLRDLVAPEVGAIVFASSQARELSKEKDEWGHGAFTKALLEAATSKASDKFDPLDGCLSSIELTGVLSNRVKDLTEGLQHPIHFKPETIRDFNVLQIVDASEFP